MTIARYRRSNDKLLFGRRRENLRRFYESPFYREELLALRADNEILKTQIAQINELLMGTANFAIR